MARSDFWPWATSATMHPYTSLIASSTSTICSSILLTLSSGNCGSYDSLGLTSSLESSYTSRVSMPDDFRVRKNALIFYSLIVFDLPLILTTISRTMSSSLLQITLSWMCRSSSRLPIRVWWSLTVTSVSISSILFVCISFEFSTFCESRTHFAPVKVNCFAI